MSRRDGTRSPGRMTHCLGLMFASLCPLAALAGPALKDWKLIPRDQPKVELVMQLVVTCTSPERVATSERSKVVDARYQLKTDDAVTLIIHNRGLTYPGTHPGEERFRLEFIAPQGKYEWLNSHVFLATLTEVPPELRLAKGADQNIEIYQVL